jgi:hypothetical protein
MPHLCGTVGLDSRDANRGGGALIAGLLRPSWWRQIFWSEGESGPLRRLTGPVTVAAHPYQKQLTRPRLYSDAGFFICRWPNRVWTPFP